MGGGLPQIVLRNIWTAPNDNFWLITEKRKPEEHTFCPRQWCGWIVSLFLYKYTTCSSTLCSKKTSESNNWVWLNGFTVSVGAHKVAEANQCIDWNSATGTDQHSIWEALCSDLNCQACKPLQLFFLFTSSDSVLELHGISLETLRTRSLVDCWAPTPGTTAQSSY